MKKSIWIILLTGLMMTGVKAQINWLHYPNAYLFPAATPEKYFYDRQQEQEKDGEPGIRLHYSINMGGSFMTSPWYKGFSSWVAPEISYAVTPRFFVSGGVRVEQFFPSGHTSLPAGGEQVVPGGPSTHLLLYGSGTYLIRPNFSVTGTIIKNLDINKNLSPYGRSFNYVPDSYSLRFDYQLGHNIHLGAEFRYMNYDNYNPFYPGAMYGPYGRPYRGFAPVGW